MDSQTLVTQLHEIDLWPEEEAARAEILRLQQRCADARQLSRELLQRNLLTAYQANQLLTGKGQSLAIGPYRIWERIGEGGMGQVFKARHFRLHRVVALKVIRREMVANPTAVQRFLREVEAAANLSHPNIVRAYDADRSGDSYYFAMQFLDGINLSQLVKKEGPLPVAQACHYAHQAALGLQHIHEHHLVHRDIKPSNLMIVRKGEAAAETPAEMTASWEQVKILDLGLARLVEEDNPARPGLTKLGTIMGTADYMSPEQSLQSSRVDIRGDIYSLGCTLYFALTGRPPFLGGTPIEKLLKHQLDAATPIESLRPDVPAALALVLNRMLAKRAQDRYQTPHEVARALQEVEDTLMPVAIAAVTAVPADAVSPPRAMRIDPAGLTAALPPEADPDGPAAFPLDETAAAVVLANRIAQAHADQSEWSLWLVLGCVGFGMLLCLLFAIFVLSH